MHEASFVTKQKSSDQLPYGKNVVKSVREQYRNTDSPAFFSDMVNFYFRFFIRMISFEIKTTC